MIVIFVIASVILLAIVFVLTSIKLSKSIKAMKKVSFAFFQVAAEPSFIRDIIKEWKPDDKDDEISQKMQEKLEEIREQELENEQSYLEEWTRPIDYLTYKEYYERYFPQTNNDTIGRVRKIKESINELKEGDEGAFDFYAVS